MNPNPRKRIIEWVIKQIRRKRNANIPANEIAETQKEGNEAAMAAEEEHGSVTQGHGDQEMEVGREAEGEVREKNAGEGGVEVLGEAAGDEAP